MLREILYKIFTCYCLCVYTKYEKFPFSCQVQEGITTRNKRISFIKRNHSMSHVFIVDFFKYLTLLVRKGCTRDFI